MAILFVVQLREAYVEEATDRHVRASRFVRAFREQAHAEAHMEALEASRETPPPTINPFGGFSRSYRHVLLRTERGPEREVCWRVSTMCSRGEEGLLVLLDELGVPCPTLGTQPGEDVPWHTWWRAHVATASVAARARIWQALDRLVFFEVVTIQLEE